MNNLFSSFAGIPQSSMDSIQRIFEDETFARVMKSCFQKLGSSSVVNENNNSKVLLNLLAETLTTKPAFTNEEINSLPKGKKEKIEGYITEISNIFGENKDNKDLSAFFNFFKTN